MTNALLYSNKPETIYKRKKLRNNPPIHENNVVYDNKRQEWIEKKGFLVIRYKNDEVLFDREALTQDIINNCDKRQKEFSSNTITPPNLP